MRNYKEACKDATSYMKARQVTSLMKLWRGASIASLSTLRKEQ